jgi:two-component system, NarL family, response regulator DevR
MAKDQIRILLVDDHEVVRDGVKALINASDGLIVVGEAGSVREAIDQAMRTKPDVVVMDVRLADGSGIEATREIRARMEKTQVLMLTSFADDEALFASIMAGAAGYVLKQIRGGELIRAIREVGAGNSLLDPEVTRSVLERLRKGKTMRDEKLARLTAQEERILTLVAQGLTNGQIGKELKLAEKTVKNYVSTILLKAGSGTPRRSCGVSGEAHDDAGVSVDSRLETPGYRLGDLFDHRPCYAANDVLAQMLSSTLGRRVIRAVHGECRRAPLVRRHLYLSAHQGERPAEICRLPRDGNLGPDARGHRIAELDGDFRPLTHAGRCLELAAGGRADQAG